MEKKVDIISLANKPITAIIASDIGELVVLKGKNVKIINTTDIRPICSISWVIPGIKEFCFPRKYPLIQL